MGIKVVRALWGDINLFIDDIRLANRNDCVVIVWGLDNYNSLTYLGFDCKMISTNDMSDVDDSEMYHLKLVAMHEAALTYKSILFLDWDTKPIKEIDPHFEKTFFGKEWCAPLYCYPENLSSYAKTPIEVKWGKMIDSMMKKYSWHMDGMNIIPMAGLIFVSSPIITKKLLDIYEEEKMKGLVEEFAMFKLANCSLIHYLKTYEPTVIRGRESEDKFTFGSYSDYSYFDLNKFIYKFVGKDCYYTHE